MATTPEGRVKEAVKKYLKEIGAWFFMPVSNGMGRHGIPDVIACVPTVITQDMVGMTLGIFHGIECKAPGKRDNTSPLQAREIEAIRGAYGIAIVVDDAEHLKKEIEHG